MHFATHDLIERAAGAGAAAAAAAAAVLLLCFCARAPFAKL